MGAALQWWQRLPSERAADILGGWLANQSRLDGLEAVEPPAFVPGGELAPVGADWLCGLSRGDVRDAAAECAQHCFDIVSAGAPWATLVHVCQRRGIDAPDLSPRLRPSGMSAESAVRRVCCRHWWAGRMRRARALELARREQPVVSRYCTPRARAEYVRAVEESSQWAQSAELVRLDSGERWTMAELIAKSVADPGVRAAELITRVKGCGEWADAQGWVGVLVTLTAPGHMHPIKGEGWTREGAREVQAHLGACWARTRAALWRQVPAQSRPIGLRVVEPHRDGTPHWHMVLWMPRDVVGLFRSLLVRYFLTDHAPDEPGAAKHRVKVDQLKGGSDGAVGYVIKYVIKHLRASGSSAAVREVAGDHEIPEASTVDTSAVQAWSRQWGVRTWQAVGGPPVTIWRSLRRVEGLGSEGFTAPGSMASAVASADSGDWCGYMESMRTEKGWSGLQLLRSPMRWDSAMQIWYEPMPGRYGDRPALVPVQVAGIESGTGTAQIMQIRRFRWGAMARGASPLGHVSLTVRGRNGAGLGNASGDGGMAAVQCRGRSGGASGSDGGPARHAVDGCGGSCRADGE